jgi:hypothetical protein
MWTAWTVYSKKNQGFRMLPKHVCWVGKGQQISIFVARCVGLFKDIGCQWDSLDKTLVCCSNHQPDFPEISSFVRVMCNLLEVFRTMWKLSSKTRFPLCLRKWNMLDSQSASSCLSLREVQIEWHLRWWC